MKPKETYKRNRSEAELKRERMIDIKMAIERV